MESNHPSTSVPFAHNGLQFLSQVMGLYPSQWNASSRRILLMDVAVLGKESNAADLAFRIHRLKENLLWPLARIILSEKEAIKSAKEKFDVNEQQLHGTVEALEAENRKLQDKLIEAMNQLAQQSMFIETLLEEMATSSQQNKLVVEQLQNIILTKDLEIQKLLADKQQLLKFHQTTVATAAVDGFTKHGILRDNTCLEWITAAEDCTSFERERSPSVLSDGSSTVTNAFDPPQKSSGLLHVVVSGAWHEGVYSFRMVEQRGILSVPLALVHFWLSLAGRVTDHVAELMLSKMKQGLSALV